MRSALIGGLVGGAVASSGGTLNLSWSDCGDSSTHGHIKSLTPSSVTLGAKTTITGKGTVDEAMQGLTYTVDAKAAFGITVFSHTGDACKPDSIPLPHGAGTLDFKGFKCPISPGDVELDIDLTLSSSIPASLARLTIDLKATTSTKDKALCMQMKTAPAAAQQTDYLTMWSDFKKNFARSYSGEDEVKRYEIFKANVDFINDSNAQELGYKLGINQFSDITAKEFGEQNSAGLKPRLPWGELPYLGRHTYSGNALPASVDWTKKGAVTPVKNQGQCGSCWAFSTTGSLEGAWEIATNKTVSLSEQQFVDCDKVDSGCGGGLMDNGFKYAEANALCTEDSYAYTGKGGTCKATSCTVGIPKGGVTGYKDVAKDDEQALMEAVAKGPVSIAIEANLPTFQMYHSGVLGSICGSMLDHGVLAVGYGTDNGKDYWKVKNSWGDSFGEAGYIRLLRGKKGAGECGLLSGPPSYPIVKATESQVIV